MFQAEQDKKPESKGMVSFFFSHLFLLVGG